MLIWNQSWPHGEEPSGRLMFSTGYAANLAVLSTLGAGARLVSDELNHASIIDGARLARSEVSIYRHGDVEHAAYLIGNTQKRTLLVTDTVFSMDGDIAPIAELSELCVRTRSMLVLDDAHAVLEIPSSGPRCRMRTHRYLVQDARLTGWLCRRYRTDHRPPGKPIAHLHLHHGAKRCRYRRSHRRHHRVSLRRR